MGRKVDVNHLNSFILNQVIKKPEDNVQSESHRRNQQHHVMLLAKNIDSVSAKQASLKFKDDAMNTFTIQIKPKDGPYAELQCDFFFKLPRKYPSAPPQVTCLTTIYHPNIDDDGEICLSLLDEWCPQNNDLLDCVQGLLYLLHQPNLDDPLNPNFLPGEFTNDEFLKNVYRWRNGVNIEEI